jgi:hypothetical protein
MSTSALPIAKKLSGMLATLSLKIGHSAEEQLRKAPDHVGLRRGPESNLN